MKHISIIVPQGHSVIDTVIAPYNLLNMANKYYCQIHRESQPRYTVDLVGTSMDPVPYQGLFSVSPTATIHTVDQTDLIIVAAISGNLEKGIRDNQAYISWIREQRIKNNAEIASLCKGAFLLAETGLLNGKSCSTHWTSQNEFVKRYPEVELVPEKIISENNGIYSSGGAYSFLNFMLYLIEKLYGREVAIQVSKVSEIEYDRLDQSPFMVFNGQKDHTDEAVLNAQNYIEQHFHDNLNISELAKRVNVSARSFLRRFKKATANTPLEYIQRVKIEAAKKKLEITTLNIQQVMYDVGYSDEKAFRNTFRKYSGLSPLDYRKKYNREMAMAGS